MKEISELNLPEDVRYTEDHEWARKDGDLFIVGINDYAQDQLGDIVFVELPEVGSTFDQGQEFGTVESVKAVSELFFPIAGEVVEVNEALSDSPELANSDPYGQGWMLKVKAKDASAFDQLLDRGSYLAKIQG
jgi:glycine cleavage system H protein